MLRTIILLLLAICSQLVVLAQDARSTTEQLINDIFEQYTAESEDAIDYETFYEDLMYCSQHPINLNNASREELEKLPFLNDLQIENIQAYVATNEQLTTIYELQLIEGLDMTDIRRMLPFVYLGEGGNYQSKIYWNELWKYANHEILLRFDKGLETKEGYRQTDENNEEGQLSKPYQGNAFYHLLKYKYSFKDRIQAGFTCEKDAGEQWLGKQHVGYDFYSAYAQLSNFGKLKTFVLGDFRANFGQGLVIRPEFGMGKSAYVLNVTPRNSGIKKYSSSDENNFFRGVGSTFSLGLMDISVFYSNKMIDADTTMGSFSSIYKTGYHRTVDELSKKNTVRQEVTGLNASVTFHQMQLGFTVVNTSFQPSFIPEKTSYNYHSFSGKMQTVAGVNYRCRLAKLNFFGETALSNYSAYATLNGIHFTPISKVSLVALYRYYSPNYNSFFANAFAESSHTNNETGLYLGAEIRPIAKWKVAAYVDSYRFMWPKYGIDAPSYGDDYLLQIDFTARRNTAMYWRIKYESKQKNSSDNQTVTPLIVPDQKASFRYNLSYSYGPFSFKNVFEVNYIPNKSTPNYGFLAVQDVSYFFKTLGLGLDARIQFFDATDYDNRLYAYEKDVIYAFSIPMYVGQGSRYYLNLHYECTKHLSLYFKIAQTTYADDRENISSANESIIGNRKTDVRFLIKWSL